VSDGISVTDEISINKPNTKIDMKNKCEPTIDLNYKYKATEAEILRMWLRNNKDVDKEDLAKVVKANVVVLHRLVTFYDGSPNAIVRRWRKHGDFLVAEYTPPVTQSYEVTATVTLIVDATDERDAMQKADEEFESRDLCCEMPWEAKLEEDREDDEADEFDAIGMKELWNQC